MDAWRSAIATSDSTGMWIRGYDVTSLMKLSFSDTIFLLHKGSLPNECERRLLDAILVGVADHGAGAPSCAAARLVASGNRQSLSAAVAAGVLAIGDDRGGASGKSPASWLRAQGSSRAGSAHASAVRHGERSRGVGEGRRVHCR